MDLNEFSKICRRAHGSRTSGALRFIVGVGALLLALQLPAVAFYEAMSQIEDEEHAIEFGNIPAEALDMTDAQLVQELAAGTLWAAPAVAYRASRLPESSVYVLAQEIVRVGQSLPAGSAERHRFVSQVTQALPPETALQAAAAILLEKDNFYDMRKFIHAVITAKAPSQFAIDNLEMIQQTLLDHRRRTGPTLMRSPKPFTKSPTPWLNAAPPASTSSWKADLAARRRSRLPAASAPPKPSTPWSNSMTPSPTTTNGSGASTASATAASLATAPRSKHAFAAGSTDISPTATGNSACAPYAPPT